jgi:hypothetical protein
MIYKRKESSTLAWLSCSGAAGDIKTWELDATGLLRPRNAVYVPNDLAVKAELLRANYNNPLGGHFGVGQMLQLL